MIATIAFTTSKNRIIHYGVVLGLFFCFAVFYRSFWLLQDFLEKSVSISLKLTSLFTLRTRESKREEFRYKR